MADSGFDPGGRAGVDPQSFYRKYKCPIESLGLIKADSLVPFVKIKFKGTNTWITVGNRSSDPSTAGCTEGGGFSNIAKGASSTRKNHASVTHFQYGCSGGVGAGGDGITVEITDEEGGDFCNFMTNILPIPKGDDEIAKSCVMQFQFGWIAQDCLGDRPKYFASQPRQCYPLTVDVAFQGGGVIKYTIHATNPAEVMASGPNSDIKTQGRDKAPHEIKTAIREKFKTFGMDVEFLTGQSSGGGVGCQSTAAGGNSPSDFLAATGCGDLHPTFEEWNFKANEKWPGTWPGNNKDPISGLQEWLKDKMTTNNRHFTFGTCNQIMETPKFIIWESPMPDCKGQSKLRNIGTFIVNGGQCSNVLEFRPQIQYVISNLNQGGGFGNAGDNIQQSGKENTGGIDLKKESCDVSGSGTPVRVVPDPTMSNLHPKDDIRLTTEAYAAAARALPPIVPIKAELVIQGWECLDDPVTLCGGTECTILVINPFYINSTTDGTKCGDWLAVPGFNAFLSSKHWFISGVSHEIKEGSFTTTLSVLLLVDSPSLTDDKVAAGGNK